MPRRKKALKHLKPTITGLLCLATGFLGGYKTNEFTPPPTVQLSEGAIQAGFSSKKECEPMIVDRMGRAKKTIDIAIFDITSDEPYKKIIAMHNAGIKVRMVTDRRQSKGKYSKIALLRQHGIPIRIAKCSGYMHHKFIIIDGSIIITGSYNLSNGAKNRNKENIVCIKSKQLCQAFLNEFEELFAKGT